MSEQLDYLTDDKPMKVLQLFRKREIDMLTLTPKTYSKLYDSLICTICQDIFVKPVYLKCSHRFCKVCIEKHIRSNTKKSCPNCRGGLATKRDLHEDFTMESLITYAFGDVKKLAKCLQDADKSDLKRRIHEQDSRRRVKLTNVEGEQLAKKFKTNSGDEIRKYFHSTISSQQHQQSSTTNIKNELNPITQNKKSKNERELLSKEIIEVNEDRTQQTNLYLPLKEFIRIKTPKKREQQYIEIRSSEDENNDQRNQTFPQEISYEPVRVDDAPPMQNSASVSEAQEASIAQNSVEVEPEESKPANQLEADIEGEQMQNEDYFCQPKPSIPEEVLQAKRLLRAELGETYLTKIMQLCPFDTSMTINIERSFMSKLTPQLPFKHIQLSCRSTLQNIAHLIATNLNIAREAVHLQIRQKTTNSLRMIQGNTLSRKLYEINEQFWKQFQGIRLFQMGDLLEALSAVSPFTLPSVESRTVYFYVSGIID